MRRAALLFLAILVTAGVGALEVNEGRLRLTLDEDTSRFLIALRTTGNRYVPLIFAEDPRTSGLDVREDNRVYRMGDGGDFRQVAEVTDEGIFYIWTSPTLRVSERFRFIRSVGGSEVDGVQIDIAVTNLGEESVPVALRLLLDTYLGEHDNAHFSTPLTPQITRETQIVPSSRESYVRSSSPDSSAALQVMLSGAPVTIPNQVAIANWKRLADSQWDYVVNEDRNFNRLPYSINDSALLLTYGERTLARNERYEITLQMGGPADNGYHDPQSSTPVSAVQRAELIGELTEILDRIDGLLADPNVSVSDVAELREQLEALSEQIPAQ